MNLILVLPILLPFATAVLLAGLNPLSRTREWVVRISSMLYLVLGFFLLWVVTTKTANGTLYMQLGQWEAPFGITLMLDRLSSIMLVMAGLLSYAVQMIATKYITTERQRFGWWTFYFVLLTGVSGAFLTGDIFNLYVWFEVMLISSFALLVLGNNRTQLDGTFKYAVLNMFSTGLLLAGVALLYGLTGSLNMLDLVAKTQIVSPELLTVVGGVLLIALCIKIALFPFYFWLPATYPNIPFPVAALFAGLMTKVSIYVLYRLFVVLHPMFMLDGAAFINILTYLAMAGMVLGMLAAITSNDVRRILTFNLIGHIGFMIIGLLFYNLNAQQNTGTSASFYYMLHHMLVMTALFISAGLIHTITGQYHLKHMGGLLKQHPALAALTAIPLLSLAGIPPFSGFWPKLMLMWAAVESHNMLLLSVMVFVGVLTLYSAGQIWIMAFWKPAHRLTKNRTIVFNDLLPLAVLNVALLFLGLFPDRTLEFINVLLRQPALLGGMG